MHARHDWYSVGAGMLQYMRGLSDRCNGGGQCFYENKGKLSEISNFELEGMHGFYLYG
jgi:hypothetical protein